MFVYTCFSVNYGKQSHIAISLTAQSPNCTSDEREFHDGNLSLNVDEQDKRSMDEMISSIQVSVKRKKNSRWLLQMDWSTPVTD